MKKRQSVMEKSVSGIVKSVCLGYNGRAAVLRRGAEASPLLSEYQRLNDAVERGLDVCPDVVIRAQIKQSLIEDLPFAYMVVYCGKNQFYRLRRDVSTAIAKELSLIA